MPKDKCWWRVFGIATCVILGISFLFVIGAIFIATIKALIGALL